MKAVLMSIKPKWVELIASGKKTVEVRNTAPKLETPFKVYVYETKGRYVTFQNGACTKYGYGRGKVVGEFTCAKIDRYVPILFKGQDFYQGYMDEEYQACISHSELCKYAKGKTVYGWHISDLKVYEKPKEITELRIHDKTFDYAIFGDIDKTYAIKRPPQSWWYVEELGE